MKNYTLFLLICLICCKSESKSSNQLNEANEIKIPQAANNLNNETNISVATERRYIAQPKDANDNFTQSLSVSWISEDIIEYTLVFDNQSCKKTIKGRATSIKNKKEPFMNSYKGASFEITKYENRKQGFKILLQVDSVNKDKAVVDLIFTEDGENENCRPHSIVMLEQK